LIFLVAAPSSASAERGGFFSDEFVGSGTKLKSKPRPFKTERVGPEKRNQLLSDDVRELGHPIMKVRQQKSRERVDHPSTSFGSCRSPGLASSSRNRLFEKLSLRLGHWHGIIGTRRLDQVGDEFLTFRSLIDFEHTIQETNVLQNDRPSVIDYLGSYQDNVFHLGAV
jgi:hypothetical protein